MSSSQQTPMQEEDQSLISYQSQAQKWTERQRKVIVENLRNDLEGNVTSYECCKSKCLSKFSMKDIQLIRREYNSENVDRKRSLVVMENERREQREDKKFHLNGIPVCVDAFIHITKVSRHSLYNPMYSKYKYQKRKT